MEPKDTLSKTVKTVAIASLVIIGWTGLSGVSEEIVQRYGKGNSMAFYIAMIIVSIFGLYKLHKLESLE
jgi:hypothetical protein